MADRRQTATMRWLRVAQLQAHFTRSVFRAGANPQALIEVSFAFLERFSRCPVRDEATQRQLLLDCCRKTIALVPQTPRSHSSLLQRFFKALERQNFGSLTVDGIATQLRVSPSHLSRAIKIATGRTPAEHIRLAKLTYARELLPENSVTRAALQSGFAKASTFIAHFKKHFGETPGAYQRRLALGA